MDENTNLAISDHYKSLTLAKKKLVIRTVVSAKIMSRTSLFKKLREHSFTILESKYMTELLKSIDHAKPD